MKKISSSILWAFCGFISMAILHIGSLSLPKEPEYKSISAIGNSITKHAPKADLGWSGNWGMAASAEDKDYAHLIGANKIANFVPWELDPAGYPLENFAKMKNDIVVIHLGENAYNHQTFKDNYQRLVDYFFPSKVICVTGFWPSPNNEVIRNTKNCTVVEATISEQEGMMLPEGSTPYWSHPSDKGMAETAKRILEIL